MDICTPEYKGTPEGGVVIRVDHKHDSAAGLPPGQVRHVQLI